MDGTLKQLYLSNYLIEENTPKRSFFRHSYDNYENYARDTRKIQTNRGTLGTTITVELDRTALKGDLISDMVLKLTMPKIEDIANVGYCNGVGLAVIEYVEFIVAGNIIERYRMEFADAITILTYDFGKYAKYCDMIKKYDRASYLFSNFQGGNLYIPLHLWFSLFTNPFPLAAAYESAIKINIKLRKFTDIVAYKDDIPITPQQTNTTAEAELLIDYIILMPNARREMLLRDTFRYSLATQTQMIDVSIGANVANKTIPLRELRYPVSQLIWMFRSDAAVASNDYFNYSADIGDDAGNPLVSCKFIFETGDRTETHDADVFGAIERFKFYQCNGATRDNLSKQYINVLPFAKLPLDFGQPSGICNFSELHNAYLQVQMAEGTGAGTLYVIAINYNVLVLRNGVAHLLHNLSNAVPKTTDATNKMNNSTSSKGKNDNIHA